MYTHLAILDFEANCLRDKQIHPQEIIEIPVVVYDIQNRYIDESKTFHYYCKPMLDITPFCTELTGITQETVDTGLPFPEVLDKLGQWVWDYGWVNEDGSYNILFVTCGDWDLKTALPKQCSYTGTKIPGYLKVWCNVKRVYKQVVGKKAPGMAGMLKSLGLPLVGCHHSGIDDARNIACIVEYLHTWGGEFRITGSI